MTIDSQLYNPSTNCRKKYCYETSHRLKSGNPTTRIITYLSENVQKIQDQRLPQNVMNANFEGEDAVRKDANQLLEIINLILTAERREE